MRTQNNKELTKTPNLGLLTWLVLVLFLFSIAQLATMYLQWKTAANLAVDQRATVVGVAVEKRLAQHNQFLRVMVSPAGGNEDLATRQLALHCRQHPEVVFSAIITDSLHSVPVAGNLTEVKQSVPQAFLDSLFSAKRESLFYEEGPRINDNRSFIVAKPFVQGNHGTGAGLLIISAQDVMKSVLQEKPYEGYETRLLDLKGNVLASTGGSGADSRVRAEYAITYGPWHMLLEMTDVHSSFWSLEIVLLVLREIVVFIVLFFRLFSVKRTYRLVHRAEYDAHREQEYFKTLWDASLDGMKLTDRTGHTVFVNKTYSSLFQISEEKALQDIAGSGATDGDAFTQQFDAGTLKVPTSQTLRRHSGEEVSIEITNSYLTTANDEKLLLSVFRNVSERKKMEEQLQEIQRMDVLGGLAEEIGNDFKNIVGIILNASESLRNHLPQTPEATQYLEMISSATHRGGDLASDLLIFARSEEGNVMPILVRQSLDQVQTVLERSLSDGITAVVTSRDKGAAVRCNSHRLTQAIVNLCLSAEKRMKKGERIVVESSLVSAVDIVQKFRTAEERDYVCISVTDPGAALDTMELRRIFEPYFSTQHGVRGAGLRLSVAYSIVKNYRGFVDAASSPENGTTVAVYLPIDHYEMAPSALTPLPAGEVFGDNRLILFADDEEAFCQLISMEFQRRGFRVVIASNGEEALALYKEHRNDIRLVVSDLSMPKMDGEELYEQLAILDPSVRMIFISGNLEHRLQVDFLRRGVRGIVEKPFVFAQLISIVKNALA